MLPLPFGQLTSEYFISICDIFSPTFLFLKFCCFYKETHWGAIQYFYSTATGLGF